MSYNNVSYFISYTLHRALCHAKYSFKIEINKNIKIKLTNYEYFSESGIFKLPAFGLLLCGYILLYIVQILLAAKFSTTEHFKPKICGYTTVLVVRSVGSK